MPQPTFIRTEIKSAFYWVNGTLAFEGSYEDTLAFVLNDANIDYIAGAPNELLDEVGNAQATLAPVTVLVDERRADIAAAEALEASASADTEAASDLKDKHRGKGNSPYHNQDPH